MTNHFDFEHWEARNEYIILFNGPVGQTVTLEEAKIIKKWLNNSKQELITRIRSMRTEQSSASSYED